MQVFYLLQNRTLILCSAVKIGLYWLFLVSVCLSVLIIWCLTMLICWVFSLNNSLPGSVLVGSVSDDSTKIWIKEYFYKFQKVPKNKT